MVELRWVRPDCTTTAKDKLKFRYYVQEVDRGSYYASGAWTEWQDVPLYVESEQTP